MKNLIVLLAILTSSTCVAQEKDALSQNKLSLDFGSFRNRYAFAINNVSYTSRIVTGINLRGNIRLRSYGTWFVFSKIAYDITPVAEIVFSDQTKPFYLSAGLGADIRLRILADERSSAENSAEPLLIVQANGTIGKFSYTVPAWTRFYSNGISIAVLPQFNWKFSKKCSAFLRYELAFLSVYGGSTKEWRQEDFIGLSLQW